MIRSTRGLADQIGGGCYDAALTRLYPREAAIHNRSRYLTAVRAFQSLYGDGGEAVLVSAPGRTEIGGNHTDHQRGRVLAAAVDLDILCVAQPSPDPVIRVWSEGHTPCEVGLRDLSAQGAADSSALVRGVAEWFSRHGYPVSGLNAYMVSRVPVGSGLSSSAAFEVAVGQLLNLICCQGRVSPAELAFAGRYAENIHMGKPCGLMDQMTSAVGGAVLLDFEHPEKPRVRPVDFDLSSSGYSLCIVDTGGSHADLTGRYADIAHDMGRVASFWQKQVLRDVDEAAFRTLPPALRQAAGDRAVMRAMHFFDENRRVSEMSGAISQKDIPRFLDLVRRSGDSSWRWLQNVVSDGEHQALALALAVSEKLLQDAGAWRVHGGGFAGTIQAFVPERLLSEYTRRMSGLFGAGTCHLLSIRPAGVVKVLPDGKPAEEG